MTYRNRKFSKILIYLSSRSREVCWNAIQERIDAAVENRIYDALLWTSINVVTGLHVDNMITNNIKKEIRQIERSAE